MKTTLFTLAFVCISYAIFAQEGFNPVAQGNYLFNGSIFINSTSSKTKFDGETQDNSKTFEIRASPRAGYFIKDNIAVGLDLFLQSSKTTFEDIDSEVTSSGFSIGPFARYYFDGGLFAEGTVGLGSTTTSSILFSEDLTSSTFGWRLGAGYALFLGDHISVEPTAYYSWESQKANGAPNNAPKNIVSSIFIGIGLTAYL